MNEEKRNNGRFQDMKKFVRYADGAKMYSMGLTKFQELVLLIIQKGVVKHV